MALYVTPPPNPDQRERYFETSNRGFLPCLICGKKVNNKTAKFVSLVCVNPDAPEGHWTFADVENINNDEIHQVGPECVKTLPKDVVFRTYSGM